VVSFLTVDNNILKHMLHNY